MLGYLTTMTTVPQHLCRRLNWQTSLLLLTTLVGTGVYFAFNHSRSIAADPVAPNPSATNNRLAELFTTWPKGKPELAFVFTGQMYGYLQKCGCTNPQTGGLERRYNFMDWLKTSKGWELLPLDLGDVSRQTKLHKQALLKYQVAMEALQEMGYRAIGIGKEEFRFPLIDALATFTLQDEKAYPRVHSANLLNKEKEYPAVDGSMIKEWDVFTTKDGLINVGVISIIGKSLEDEIRAIDPKVSFTGKNDKVVADCLANIKNKLGKSADINVLLYQGSLEDAKVAAKFFPDFQVILCRSEESEPPALPLIQDKTLILQVGHKGRNVGVLGLFRENDRLNFYYEKVAITEDFETAKEKESDHPILKKYDWYAKEVRDRNYLQQYPKTAHSLASAFPNEKVYYIGSQTCLICHPSEHTAWTKTKHSHAYEALEKYAKKPSMRNFDGECIICHTVGFEFTTGFDGTAQKMHLKDVGCEVCHGPGSLHGNNQFKKDYYPYLSPWKVNPGDKLPSIEKLKKIVDAKTPEERQSILTQQENQVLLRVDAICQKCHDTDNDPKYQFEKYWPQIHHPSPVKKK